MTTIKTQLAIDEEGGSTTQPLLTPLLPPCECPLPESVAEGSEDPRLHSLVLQDPQLIAYLIVLPLV